MDNGESNYRRYLSGDDESLTQIIRDYSDGLTLYINRYVGNIFTAEELMEDTFFKIAVKKPRFSGKSSFKTWLYTVGRNTAIDYLRKSVRHEARLEDVGDIAVEEASVEKTYLREERRIAVHKALGALSPDYSRVLQLVYFENFSNGEVSAILGKSKRQTENLIYRAKGALKKQLEKDGFEYEEL